MAGRPRKYATPEEARRANIANTVRLARLHRQEKQAHLLAYPDKDERNPAIEEIGGKRAELALSGYQVPEAVWEFKDWIRTESERSLYFFSKFIIGHKDLSPTFHREVCEWLTSLDDNRNKLLMLPVGHLKTSIVSQSLPIHILIQPPSTDIYFPTSYTGGRGQDCRIVLGAENRDKAQENLAFLAEHLEKNKWIRWLWPHICWDNPRQDSSKWSAWAIVGPRTKIYKEYSITALGAEQAITGRHYDVILPDDLATLKAAQSVPAMERAKRWLRSSRSRLHDPFMSIRIGIGTHQGPDDVYMEWIKESGVETRIRGIEEGGIPIWPERYTPEVIEKLRVETDSMTWSLWYMNRPVSAAFTAMLWEDLREFRAYSRNNEPQYFGLKSLWSPDGGSLEFEETRADEELVQRREMINNPMARFAATGKFHNPSLPNRALMIKRYFPQTQSPQFLEYIRDKYPDKVKEAEGNAPPPEWEEVVKGRV